MLDIKWIRDNPDLFDLSQKKRGQDVTSETVIQLDEERRHLQTQAQGLLAQRNKIAKEIGQKKAAGDHDGADALSEEAAQLKIDLSAVEGEAALKLEQQNTLLASVPNILADVVPEGGEEDGLVVRTVGAIPTFDFTPRSHDDLGVAMGGMDFEKAALVSGARFVYLKGALSKLERALGNFMLDEHSKKFGYTEVTPPLLVRDQALFGTGQLPKFAEDQFQTTDDRWLIPTAEVPLTNLVREEILDEATLPRRYAAYTPCFRSEAGSAGKDTRGMFRHHQFSKVELVSIAHPDHSEAELDHLTAAAENILQQLGLAYRVVLLAAKDTGSNAAKTYDLEVWLPAQGRYREISSCSQDTDYQARRMQARFTSKTRKEKPRFIHTLNGSGLAVGRTIIALLENYQQADGGIKLPAVLKSYLGGKNEISQSGDLV